MQILLRNRRLASSFQHLPHRLLTTDTAREILGIPKQVSFTPQELRAKYFEAAKQCHPDTLRASNSRKVDTAVQFRRVTDAYELLQNSECMASAAHINDYGITENEEEEYRRACLEFLGVPAEVVEESKQCPSFRQWLQGRTDAAHHWNRFFCSHGGLAPKLRPRKGLPAGRVPDPPKSSTRRRRQPHSSQL